MEKFSFFEKPKEEKIKREKTAPKKSFLKRVKETFKIGALTVLLSVLGTESVFAGEKSKITKEPVKIEQVVKQEKQIENLVAQKGRQGRFEQKPVKMLKSRIGTIVISYDHVTEKPSWVLFETSDANLCYLDQGNDGKVDRLVLNQEDIKLNRKSAENALDALSSFESLTETARVEADLQPVDKAVYDFSKSKEGKTIVQTVNFRTGEVEKESGVKAEEITQKVQNAYSGSLEHFIKVVQQK